MAGRSNQPDDTEALLESYAPRVYGLLVRLVGRPDVAEDLTQETLLRAFRSLDTYEPQGKFQAWIFRIAVNLARDWIRRRPRDSAVSLDDGPDSAGAASATVKEMPPDAAMTRTDRAKRVESALAPAAGRPRSAAHAVLRRPAVQGHCTGHRRTARNGAGPGAPGAREVRGPDPRGRTMNTCPNETEWVLYAAGELDAARQSELRAHLAACRACSEEAARLGRGLRALRAIDRDAPMRAEAMEALRRRLRAAPVRRPTILTIIRQPPVAVGRSRRPPGRECGGVDPLADDAQRGADCQAHQDAGPLRDRQRHPGPD